MTIDCQYTGDWYGGTWFVICIANNPQTVKQVFSYNLATKCDHWSWIRRID